MSASERTVIVDPAFLGDVVFDAPLVHALKRRSAVGTVGIVVRPSAAAIARAIDGIDHVHVFDKRGTARGLGGLRRAAAELRRVPYDVALIPHPSLRSALLPWMAGIPRRIGTAPGLLAQRFLTSIRAVASEDTFVSARLRLLGNGVPGADEGGLSGTLRRPPDGVAPRGPEGRPTARVGLVLGSEWETKRWPVEQAARLVDALDPAVFEVVGLGADAERPLFEALGRRLRVPRRGLTEGVGGPVERLLEHIARCDVLVGGDTGPVHIARGFGIPVVGLFGPTSEAKHRFEAQDRVLSVAIECRPCSPHGHRVCPLGHHRCMADLDADRVHEAVVRATAARLARTRARGEGSAPGSGAGEGGEG